MCTLVFPQEIYTYDIDFAGHVSNISYVRWMEIGRLKLLEEAGMPVATLMREGILPALAETRIAYKKPLFLGDALTIEVWVSRLRHASAEMAFHFYTNHNHLAAVGLQKGLFIDSTHQRPIRISDEQHDRFARLVCAEKKVLL